MKIKWTNVEQDYFDENKQIAARDSLLKNPDLMEYLNSYGC